MHRLLSICLACVFVLVSALPASAVTLLRDPDIENALNQLAKPVLSAAGLSPARVRVLVVQDRNMNAFVIDNKHIFIHSGMIMRLKGAAELQAVIAHEAAHLAHGHIARRTVNARVARNVAGIGMALAAAAAASGSSEAATALGAGISSSASRVFMGHTRAEESSADQSAIRYLSRAGVDPKGLVRVIEIFAGQELVSAARQDPYARTHPISRDRLRHANALADTYSKEATADPEFDYWFSRAKGKLTAFLRSPKWTRSRAEDSAAPDIELMRRAISHHRDSDTDKAVAAMQKLVAAHPRDPFYHELYGQILMESRNTRAALTAYRDAVNLAPNDALVLGSYGHALLAAGDSANALKTLEKSRSSDGNNARVMRDLGQAYAKSGQMGMASLVTAERYALRGRIEDAGIHAKRASDLLPRGSAGWQRAQDVLLAAEAAGKKRR
ncbi:MAG: putative zinc metalloprotease [Rhodobacteraceae bacterium HLUCCO07]|nr:MAG: putative zinc metalloprotease [Rhodobacteraceae bacterium HLUCCO07]